MLVSEMITEFREHGFDDLTDSRILSFLNDAYFDICAREPWPFLETTATVTMDSNGLVTSPTDIHQVQAITDTANKMAIKPRRYDELADIYGALTDTGQSLYYYFIGDSLYMYPIDTGGTYKVYYLKQVPALTSSPDTSPIFNAYHHRNIIVGGLAKAAVMEDDPDLAAVFTNIYETRMQQMRQSLWKKQYDETDVIQDMFWEDNIDWVY